MVAMLILPDGTVRWLWLRWYGLPWPYRLWLWSLGGPRPRSWAGCGCLVAAKRAAAWAGFRIRLPAARAMRVGGPCDGCPGKAESSPGVA